MLSLLLLAAVTTAAPDRAIDRQDWDRFLAPQAFPESKLKDWLGYQPALEPETPAVHYFLPKLMPYKGGVDLFTDEKTHEVTSARFYLVYGPIYSDEHIAAARKLHTPYTLADVEKWYGKPDERTVFRRTGAPMLVYHPRGDKKLELDFVALPGSTDLHAIYADRDAE